MVGLPTLLMAFKSVKKLQHSIDQSLMVLMGRSRTLTLDTFCPFQNELDKQIPLKSELFEKKKSIQTAIQKETPTNMKRYRNHAEILIGLLSSTTRKASAFSEKEHFYLPLPSQFLADEKKITIPYFHASFFFIVVEKEEPAYNKLEISGLNRKRMHDNNLGPCS